MAHWWITGILGIGVEFEPGKHSRLNNGTTESNLEGNYPRRPHSNNKHTDISNLLIKDM